MKSHKKNLQFSIVILFTSAIISFPLISMANKSVYGYLEPVTLAAKQVTLTAKLDTGAETASLSARNIQLYEKEGQEYVKFIVAHPELEQAHHYNLPLARHARIKKRANDRIDKSSHNTRPVVEMKIHFDDKQHEIMVNLIDRSHFSTPMLLGRKALEKMGALVDSTQENTLLEETDS